MPLSISPSVDVFFIFGKPGLQGLWLPIASSELQIMPFDNSVEASNFNHTKI